MDPATSEIPGFGDGELPPRASRHPTHLQPIRQVDLDGVLLLLKESHAVPVVSIDLLIDVGSKDEPDHVPGAVHFIEHLLFRTHDGDRPTDPAERIQSVGGEMNAYTLHDFTCCTLTVGSHGLDLALDVQAELLRPRTFRRDDIEAERRIILEEIRIQEEDPEYALHQAGYRRVFGDHPYSRPVHGGRRAVRQLKASDLTDFFRAFYGREQVTVIAVGDFHAGDVISRLKGALQDLHRIVPRPRTWETPPRPPEPGRTRLRRPTPSAQIEFVFPAVPLLHPDYPALAVLGIVLGGGRASRVSRELVERRNLAHAVDNNLLTLKLAGLIGLGVSLDPRMEGSVRNALDEELRRVRSEPIRTEELALARAKVEAGAVFRNETVSGQSYTLGYLAALADAEYEGRFLDAVRSLQPEDLLRVAQQYLGDDRRIDLYAGPRWWSPRPLAAEPPPRPLQKDCVIPPLAPRHPAPPADTEGDVRKVVIPNQARFLIRELHDLPIASIAAILTVGAGQDPPGRAGLAALVQAILHRGTRTNSPEALSTAFESIGADTSGNCTTDAARIDCYGLSRDFPRMASLLAEMLIEPALCRDELEKLRAETLIALATTEMTAESHAHRMLCRALFGEHPYAEDAMGSVESVEAITLEDVQAFHRDHYRGGNCILTAVGDLDWSEAAEVLASAFGRMPPGQSVPPRPRAFPELPGIVPLHVRHLGAVPGVIFGWRLPPISHRDTPALQVLSTLLGGPVGSRLWRELREKRGLVYSTGADLASGIEAGLFTLSAASSRRNLPEVQRIILDQLAQAHQNPCQPEELERAKQYLIGSHEIAHQGVSGWADLLGAYEASGLGQSFDREYPRRVSAVDADEVLRVARTHLPLDRHVILTSQPPWSIRRFFQGLVEG